jgi:hypothetical protein
MWQNLLGHCAVFTKVSEEFTPHYLAEIRHDMRQTTLQTGIEVSHRSEDTQTCTYGSMGIIFMRVGIPKVHQEPVT